MIGKIREVYGLPEVAALIELASERYMTLHAPLSTGYNADRSPCECGQSARLHAAGGGPCGKAKCPCRNYRPTDKAEAAVSGEYADLIHRKNLTDGERQRIVVGMADLDLAMRRVNDWVKQQVAEYLEQGPAEINQSEVIFRRTSHFRAICVIQREMNGEVRD